MHRREFLAALSALGFAGCAGEPTPVDGDIPTSAPTTNTVTESVPAATPVAEQAMTSTETETVTKANTETATTTPTPSPAEEHIDRARVHLSAAVDAYTSSAGQSNVGIVDVDASTSEFSAGAVNSETNEARDSLALAEVEANGEAAERVAGLQTTRIFLDHAARCQTALTDLFEAVTDVLGDIRNGQYQNVRESITTLEDGLDTVEDTFDDLEDGSESSSLAPIDGLTGDDYRSKMAQFEGEIGAFDAIIATLPDFNRALETFDNRATRYTQGGESVRFYTGRLESTRSEVADAPTPGSLKPTLHELDCVSRVFLESIDHMRDAVAARGDGNQSTAERAACHALKALDGCEHAARYHAAEPLQSLDSC